MPKGVYDRSGENPEKPSAFEQPMDTHERQGEGATVYEKIQKEEGAVTQERPPMTSGETVERFMPRSARDSLYLGERHLKKMGMEGAVPSSLAHVKEVIGDKVYITMPDPRYYTKQPAIQRSRELRWDSFEVPTDENGQPYSCGFSGADLVYALVDRKEYLAKLDRHNAYSHSFTKGVIERRITTNNDGGGEVGSFNDKDPDSIEAEKERIHRWFDKNKTSLPAGISVEEYEEKIGAAAILEMERYHARGGRTAQPNEYEEYEARMREQEKAERSRKGNGKVSFPGSPTR